MVSPNPAKRRAMDAVSHRETAALVRLLKGKGKKSSVVTAAPGPVQGFVKELKRQAKDAVANVETVAQIGALKLTGGLVAYVGRIREMDRENMRHKEQARREPRQRTARVERLERD